MAAPADAAGGTDDGATFGAVVPMAEATAPTASTAQSPAPGCTSPDAVTGAAFPRSDGDRGPTTCR
jgi:hypothetical protein